MQSQSTALVTPATTSPEIALGNLDVQIRAREALVQRNPHDVDAASQLVDLLLSRGQFRARIADYERAEAIADALVTAHPDSGAALLTHAATLGTFHLFARELDTLDAAERLHASTPAVLRARATAYMGQGRFDDADALGVWRGTDVYGATELASAAVLAGERGLDVESERLFEKARSSHRDVSPFEVAWVDFQRASLLERKGQRLRAKLYFAEAQKVMPTFAHASVHLAWLESPEDGRTLLEGLLGKSDDPEIDAAYADALRRLGRRDEARRFIDRARARYEALVASHAEAFADHAAAFYLGIGGDPARALDLARKNVQNRHTEAALDLWMAAAQIAGTREEACASAAQGAALRYVSPFLRASFEATLHGCGDASTLTRSP